jgi:hypothetical protein
VGAAAAEVAKAADLLIVSTSGERDLSAQVEKWIELWAWLASDTFPAVVALFQKVNCRQAEKIQLALRRLANRRGFEYFAQANPQPRPTLVRAEREHLTHPGRWQHYEGEWADKNMMALHAHISGRTAI